MFIVRWQNKALRQFEKIRDTKSKKHIFSRVQELSSFPNCKNIKQLKGHKYDFRLRIGDYRILFNIEKYIEIVSIEEVKIRNEQTY